MYRMGKYVCMYVYRCIDMLNEGNYGLENLEIVAYLSHIVLMYICM